MTTREDLASMFGWGAVGGALPTVSKIAGTYGANFDAPTPRVAGVLIAIALYASIGAVVARAMNNPEMKQALFAGIAAPAIVVSIITGVSDSRGLNNAQQQHALSFFTSAFAQPSAPGASSTAASPGSSSKSLLVEASTDGGLPINGVIRIDASVPGGGLVPAGVIEIYGNYQRTTINVPENATDLIFFSNGRSTTTPVPPSSRVMLKVYPVTSTGGDLLWALGSKRGYEIGGLGVASDPGQPLPK